MKTIRILAIALLAVCAASCSKSFNEERAAQLIDKLDNNGDTWTEEDDKEAYTLAIDYLDCYGEYIVKAAKKADSIQQYDELLAEFSQANPSGGYLFTYAIYTYNPKYTEELNDAIERFLEAQSEADDILEEKLGISEDDDPYSNFLEDEFGDDGTFIDFDEFIN